MDNQPVEPLNSLTGLRFVAALAVFVSHVLGVFPLPGAGDLTASIIAPLGLGGVGFFYVLSGFILTYVYSQRTEPLSLLGFYGKRIARIWPLHLVTTAIVLFGVVTIRYQLDRPNGVAQLLSNIFLLQSWWPDYQWVFSINGPSWSLSNEAFFYLMFPWLLAGGAVAFYRKFLGMGLVGVVLLIGLSMIPETLLSERAVGCLVRANPLLRLFDFMVGMAGGFIFIEFRKRTAGALGQARQRQHKFLSTVFHVVTLASCAIYYAIMNACVGDWDALIAGSYGVGIDWLCFSGAAPLFVLVIFAFAQYASRLSELFASSWLVYLGEISFAFYLIHQPILTMLSRQALADSPHAMVWLSIAAFCFSLAAAMLLHHLVELPSRAGMVQMFSTAGSSSGDSRLGWLSRCRSWLGQYVVALWRVCLSPKALVIAGLLTVGYLVADVGLFNFRDTRLIQRVVRQTANEFKGIQFDQDAVLEGVQIAHQPDGSCQIQMAWDLKEGRRPIRFLHICDSQGKILRHGDGNRSMFVRATGNERVLDRVTVSKDQLESAAMLAVGFFGPDRKSSPIVNPAPGQPTHRLPILRLNQSVEQDVEAVAEISKSLKTLKDATSPQVPRMSADIQGTFGR